MPPSRLTVLLAENEVQSLASFKEPEAAPPAVGGAAMRSGVLSVDD